MYASSQSDYISLKHDQEMKNKFYSRDSSNHTQVVKINTLFTSCTLDYLGNPEPATWFNLPISPEFLSCSKAKFVDLTNTTPLMMNPPEMSTEQYKPEIKPCSSYTEFRQNLKLCKRHYKKFPTMAFTK